ncbi:MAG: hypothetical protein RLY31_2128 [Bacteroidota bacterium]|jgi:acyl carrier protein
MDIQQWLINKIAEETATPPAEVDIDRPFPEMELDSLATISMAFDLEKEFQLEELSPTVFTEFDTIRRLSEWLGTKL